jgi:2-keto-4-pentenoate hydratase
VALDGFSRASIEVEICLRVGADGRATEAAPAFELIDRRIPAGADDATVIADGCANWGIVVGPFRSLPEAPLVELEARMLRDGASVASCRPREQMDDPLLSFARLKDRLAEYGRTLTPGQCVITGSITKQDVDSPSTWVGEIEQLGAVELTFA